MKFKSLSLIVGFSILSLVACNNGGSGGNSPAPAEQTAPTTPTETENTATPAPEVAQPKNKKNKEISQTEKELREKYAKLDKQLVQIQMKDDEKDLVEALSFSKLLEENYEHLDEVDERAIFIARLKADTTAIFEVDGEEVKSYNSPRGETRIIAIVGKELRLKSAHLRSEAYGATAANSIPMIRVSNESVTSMDVIEVNVPRNESVEELDPVYEDGELRAELEAHLQEQLAKSRMNLPTEETDETYDCDEKCNHQGFHDQRLENNPAPKEPIHGVDFYYWYELSNLDVDRQLKVNCSKYGFEIVEEIMERQLNKSFVNAQMEKSGLIAMKCMARTYPKETAKIIARTLDGRKTIDAYLKEINSPVLAVAAGQLALLKDGKSDLTEDLLDDLKIDQHNLRKDISIAMGLANDDNIVLMLLRHLTKYKADSDQKFIYRPAAQALVRLNHSRTKLERAMFALMKKDRNASNYR
ncbi:MAG: hypothetical protein VX642_14665, partial [Bdellovibrionota bacterium]|nr:hypothetical protein [Bdellovibrionota bacterium]